MAELEDAPWAKKGDEELPDAPWHKPEVGVGEDAVKGLISGAAQGVLAIPGTGGDLQNLAKAAADKSGLSAHDPLGWITHKLDENFPGAMKFVRDSNAKGGNEAVRATSGDMPGAPLPSTADIQGQVEKATGPFYQAQTPIGKGVQTAAQVAPSIALGGGSVPGVLAKSAGAGAGSEGLGEAADALKGYLPQSAQPYAEPVARAIGTFGGMFAPAASRRAITPLPMTDERLATVNALRQSNPELVNASTAGQLTQSPGLQALEARAPSMADVGQRQAEGYTQGVMRQAGAPGQMFDTPGLAAAKSRGGEIDALQNANRMSPSEYQLLNRGVGQDRAGLFREVGRSPQFEQVRDEIRFGPAKNPKQMPLDMTGERYGALKQIVQNAGDAAAGSTSHEQTAIYNVRRRLNEAFHNSMTPEDAQQLRDLDQGYANYKTIENIPTKAGQNTVTPDQVNSKAPRGSGLETHANQASEVMTPMPKPNNEVPPWVDLGVSALSGLLHGGAGLASGAGHGGAALLGSEGVVSGHLLAPSIYKATKDAAGRVVSSDPGQAYLGNQRWRPGPNSGAPDRDTLIRLLMAPPVRNALPAITVEDNK